MKNKKFWAFVGLILLVFVLNHIFKWSTYLGNEKNLTFLKEMIQDNLAGAITIYILVTVVGSVVLALPGVTFAVLAGLLFGPVLGTILCTVSATVGAVLAFVAGRFFLKDSIRPAAMKNKHLKKWLFDESGKNQLFVLMVTRLVPVFPYNLQNFAYGVTDIRFSTYTAGSFVFMIPGTAMYTIGTAGLADEENRIIYIGIAVLIAIVVILTGVFLKRRFVRTADGENDQ